MSDVQPGHAFLDEAIESLLVVVRKVFFGEPCVEIGLEGVDVVAGEFFANEGKSDVGQVRQGGMAFGFPGLGFKRTGAASASGASV